MPSPTTALAADSRQIKGGTAMYGNYTLYAYDDKFNCVQEWSFEDVKIEWDNNVVIVRNRQGLSVYVISTERCTVIVMEDSQIG